MIITEEMLSELRRSIANDMSEKRYSHTLGVERMARYLAGFLLPDRINEISAAALLHDISKEIPIELQIIMLKDDGFDLSDEIGRAHV